MISQKSGADSITIHLREDRRHISDTDLFKIAKIKKIKVNLEIAPTREMLAIAIKAKPDFAEAYNNLGKLYLDKLELNESLSCIETAIKLKPSYENIIDEINNYFTVRLDYAKSINLERKQIILDPHKINYSLQLKMQLKQFL